MVMCGRTALGSEHPRLHRMIKPKIMNGSRNTQVPHVSVRSIGELAVFCIHVPAKSFLSKAHCLQGAISVEGLARLAKLKGIPFNHMPPCLKPKSCTLNLLARIEVLRFYDCSRL